MEFAYTNYETASITVGTMGATRPRVECTYWPGDDRARVQLETTGEVAQVDEIVAATAKLFPDPIRKPLVFISWGGAHSEGIAGTLLRVLESRLPRSAVFFSSVSIDAGSDPLKAMVEDGVLKASALVVILTRESAGNPWTVWETASAWARGALVVPLFVNVSPRAVGGPLISRVQGVSLSQRVKLDAAIGVIARRVGEPTPAPLTDEEYDSLVRVEPPHVTRSGPVDRVRQRLLGLARRAHPVR